MMRRFRQSPVADADGYTGTVDSDSVRDGQLTVVVIQGRRVILTRFEGQLIAFDAACPHAAADLSKGTIHRRKICCHEHDYCFDLVSGRIVWPEDEIYRLRRHEVKETDGQVKVRLG